MPESIRTDVDCSEYNPSRSIRHMRSPIRTRAQCRPDEDPQYRREIGSGSDEEGPGSPGSPSEQRHHRMQAREGTRGRGQRAPSNRGNATQDANPVTRRSVKDVPYCTHKCLLGLMQAGDLDLECPNSRLHGFKHVGKRDFLLAVKQQLLDDTDADANCLPLNFHGARGCLLKICLATRGYTFVAKGSEKHNLEHLRNERQIYQQLWALQGTHVPVCLGKLALRRVYHYGGARLSHLLLMSWGGQPLSAPSNKRFQACFPKLAETALIAIHRQKIRHNDAEPRNMVFDIASKRLMVIDFERSTWVSRPALTPRSSNVVMDHNAKKRTWHQSAEEELVALRNCMHYCFG